jgi:hypothetical protein
MEHPPLTVICTMCGGKGTLARLPGKTMDNQPVGEVPITRSELYPQVCEKCSGSGLVAAPLVPDSD